MKYYSIIASGIMFALMSCGGNKTDENPAETDSVVADTAADRADDSYEQTLYETSDGYRHVDELFDDFLFTFVRSRQLQKERRNKNVGGDFSFMCGDYTTNFFSNKRELSLKEDTLLFNAVVEKINLNERNITEFYFKKQNGRWQLVSSKKKGFDESDMKDFLDFYAKFSSDSTFEEESLAGSIRFSMMDPEADDQEVDGTIDRAQFPAMCSEIPHGIISNIRYGQRYSGKRKIMLQKLSMGDGMSETFTFEKRGDDWKLTGYEN